MIEEIKKLEQVSRLLEPNEKNRGILTKEVIEYSNHFLNNIESINAFNEAGDKGIGLLESPFTEEGGNIDEAIGLIKDHVDYPGLNPASGGHLGYIPGGGIFTSALGDYLADISNRYAGIFFASPGAVRMENMLIRWMAEIVGYPSTAAGNLASGGSIANLICITSAREAHGIKARDIEKTVIYQSSLAHHCIDKAIRIAGLGECPRRFISTDKQGKIIPSALKEQIVKDKSAGLSPWLVIASAGTTDQGAIDPLDELSEIAISNRMWFHVDAAYGGFFILTKGGKELLKGIEKSDSVVMDPHKGMFLPYGLGVALVKDNKPIRAAHNYQANYMQDAKTSIDEFSPADLSPELTKHFRGLRMWLPLKIHGIKPFRACLEEKLLLARYFHAKIQELGFEVGPYPQLSVVTYRYIPEDRSIDPDQFNEKLVKAVQKDGRVFISSTLIDGKFTLRLAILSFRTHLSTVDLALQILREKRDILLGEMK